MFGFYHDSFTIFGLNISFYGLLIAIGMFLGVFVACKNAKFRGLKTDDLIIVACYALPLAIVGARLYYVFFSLDSFHSFWEVFQIWNGGMAIYGGVIGGTVGVILYCLIHKKNFLDVADVAVPSLILGQAVGRIGCYFAGCCYGIEVTNPSMQWFPFATQINGVWHYSTFFYESIWNFATFAILMVLIRKDKLNFRGSLMCLYMIIYGLGRGWIEAIRGDSLFIGNMKVSQFLSVLLFVFGVCFMIASYLLYSMGKIKSIKQLKPFYEKEGYTEKTEKKKKILKFKLKNNNTATDESENVLKDKNDSLDNDKNQQDKLE